MKLIQKANRQLRIPDDQLESRLATGWKEVEATPASEKVFKCPYCDKAYKTEEGLKKHIAEKHPENAGDKE